jgi:hypothetical protein
MQSALVNWQMRQVTETGWRLTFNVAGRGFDVAKVEAIDFEAAAKAFALQLELALQIPAGGGDEGEDYA